MPRKTLKPQDAYDDLGLPLGKATFTDDEVEDLGIGTRRQRKRWRLTDPPVLAGFHPGGANSPVMYKRAELVRFLSK